MPPRLSTPERTTLRVLEAPAATADHIEHPDQHEPRFDVGVKIETHLAWLQSRMSTERTLMSCVRTATALIGFGFTIVQFGAVLLRLD